MTHGSLFSGIGGFDLAAQWMGWENVFNCENDPFLKRVLKKHWPDANAYSDIKETAFLFHRGRIDVLSGGFPCQPWSHAGHRKGTDDERHLWPEMLRAIREIRPRWVVAENVYGLISWSGGLVFEQVQADLEVEGYEVFAYVLPACGINAPHRRDRVWIVAHANSHGQPGSSEHDQTRSRVVGTIANSGCVPDEGGQNVRPGQSFYHREDNRWKEAADISKGLCKEGFAADAYFNRRRSLGGHEACPGGEVAEMAKHGYPGGYDEPGWEFFPTQSPVHRRDDGIPHRVDRIKSLGNAIVPQVALKIFKTIEQYEQLG